MSECCADGVCEICPCCDKGHCDHDTPLVGVVVKHAPPELLITMDPEDDTTHGWMQIGWIANDG